MSLILIMSTSPKPPSSMSVSVFFVCCGVVQCAASKSKIFFVCCGVVQCAANVCCGVVQCAAVCCSLYVRRDEEQTCVAVCCRVRGSVCCSVLQCVAVCCSVLQCVAD